MAAQQSNDRVAPRSALASEPLSSRDRTASDCLSSFYRCPEEFIRLVPSVSLTGESGYFRFGDGAICHGMLQGHRVSESPKGVLYDASRDVHFQDGHVHLPFDPAQVIENLRLEKYVDDWRHGDPMSMLARSYYLIRPLLPV